MTHWTQRSYIIDRLPEPPPTGAKPQEKRPMPIYHYTPTLTTKTTMNKNDWPGWYEIARERSGVLIAECRWWNGKEWNHGPNMRRGWKWEDSDKIKSITRLTPTP